MLVYLPRFARPSQHINHVRFLTGESTVKVKWQRRAFENKAKDSDTGREHLQNRRRAPYNRTGNGTTLREDKGDRKGMPQYTPYSLGNSSRIIFKTTNPKGD